MTHAPVALPPSLLLTHLADISRVSFAAGAASSLLLAAIWQGAILAALIALALRLVPRIPAAARFAIWFAVFSLIAALPFLPLLGFAPHAAALRPSHTSHAAWFHLDSRWTIAIAVIWAIASLTRAATLIAAALRVRTLSRRATPISVSHAPNASRRAQVCSSTGVDRPTVIGFFSPKILIPAWLLEKLTAAELEHVILHEAGHLNRADDWLNLLQKIALVLFPLNPALAWVERRLCFERELACDERVLNALAARTSESTRVATSYASCLTTLAGYRIERRSLIVRETARNLALALGALGRESELGRRVTRILRPAACMKPVHVRFATGTAIAVLLFATTGLEHTPQLISFTLPAPATQIASGVPARDTAMEPGAPSYAERTMGSVSESYRAVAARITLPAMPPLAKLVGDARPHLSASHPPTIPRVLEPAEPRAISVRANLAERPITRRAIATRQREPQPDLIVTRWTMTTWQSSDGYRVVRTSAVFSSAPGTQTMVRNDVDPTPPSAAQDRTISPQAQETVQPIPSYTAVPVPGGWLVFQL